MKQAVGWKRPARNFKGARRALFPLAFSAVAALVMTGCGGKKFISMKPSEVVVPQELEKTYEVREYSGGGEAPVSGGGEVSVAPKAKITKNRKKTKTAAGETAELAGAASSQRPQAAEGSAAAAPVGFAIPNRRPKPDPVWVDEKIWMDVTWLKTRAGEFLLEVLPYKEINSRKVYHVRGTARTADFFAFIYKAEDVVESFVDYVGWFPHRFTLRGNETRYLRNYLELFDHAGKKQYVHTMNHKLKTGEVNENKGYRDLTPFSQDSISALYYARAQTLEPGMTIRFPMTTNGKQWETELVVLAREEIGTGMGKMRAIKTQVHTKFQGVIQQKGDSFIWFSDDMRKFPLKFEAKVKIGWLTGTARKIEPGTSPGS